MASGRTLIVPPSQNYSRGKTVTAPSPRAAYPASNGTDGSLDTVVRSTASSGTISLSIGGAQIVNILALLNHNIYPDVELTLTAGALSQVTLARDHSIAFAFPNTSASSFSIAVGTNPFPISFGEIVAARGFEFEGVLREPATEVINAFQNRAELEKGKLSISASGAISRSIPLSLSMNAAELAQFIQICEEVSSTVDERVIVVPDSTRPDIFLVDWPLQKAINYSVSDQGRIEVSMTLYEQAGGVV